MTTIPFISPAPQPTATLDYNCAGSGQKPAVKSGKPHCPKCGKKFRWQDLINQVTQIPDHD